ncbi:MAG: Lrp/AsnC family transcriptional regulator [Gemmatimonadaceae bacterium]
MLSTAIPTEVSDPVNARILSVSEDRLAGFVEQPFREIAELAKVAEDDVHERLAAMLRARTIRRIRQTLMATNLAPGALVAWRVPPDRLDAAFEYMSREDPFSGHVVIRSTDAETPGSVYRLWTTVKVPLGFSMQKHCELLAERTGAEAFRIMPAKRLFVLGVGHMRRRGMPPGSRTDEPGQVIEPVVANLSYLDWQVLGPLKREFTADEIGSDPWRARAEEAGLPYDEFLAVARALDERGVIGRFSTFLEHVRPSKGGERVTRYNALFHWRVREGREIEAGREIGRHHILTHAYWREGGPEFGNVNVMAVAHGLEKDVVYEHKQAIDDHLASLAIPVMYTNVFWGGRSEIKPSELSPVEYERWCVRTGVDPKAMRADIR